MELKFAVMQEDATSGDPELVGPAYLEVLAEIVRRLRPRTYVEIGVAKGSSLARAKPPIMAIGIDPQPRLVEPLTSSQRVFEMTSDAFFAAHDLRAEFGGLPVDLAFIDGMHLFEYTMRDFANVERACTPQSTILLHDCFPRDRASAERERHQPFWTGDVWRLIVLLRKYRSDLQVHTIATPPTGLGIVRNLDPTSTFLHNNHDWLREELVCLDYSHLENRKASELNLVPNTPASISALLEER